MDPSAHCAAGTTVQKVISNLGSAAFSSLSNSYNDSPSASDGYTQSVINSKITELNNKFFKPTFVSERRKLLCPGPYQVVKQDILSISSYHLYFLTLITSPDPVPLSAISIYVADNTVSRNSAGGSEGSAVSLSTTATGSTSGSNAMLTIGSTAPSRGYHDILIYGILLPYIH